MISSMCSTFYKGKQDFIKSPHYFYLTSLRIISNVITIIYPYETTAVYIYINNWQVKLLEDGWAL